MIRFPVSIRSRQHSRGAALLLALGAVVLLTVLILAFFSNSLLNRQISFSGTSLIKADQLARSCAGIVTGELREEIADPSYSSTSNGGSSAYPTFYPPLVASAGNAVPQKVGLSSPTTPYLIAVSAPNKAIDPGANGRTLGSSVLISTPSLNGRYLSSDRWFGSGGPQLGSNGNLPTWVYVTHGGLQTPALTSVADPASPGYVIGRFAYTVYDEGGLMDVNVAGYPTVAVSQAPFKSSLSFADLTQIPGMTTTFVSNLTAWRNALTGADSTGNTFAEWAAGPILTSGPANLGAPAAAAAGHISAAAGDNAFFSRQDLLQAAQDGIAGLTTTLAGDLTHFSRASNTPSWSPPAAIPSLNSTTNPNLYDVRFSIASTVTHYDDEGTSSTCQVLAGDPLIQHRFSLAKLAWITSTGIKPGVSSTAMQACFGLSWDSVDEQWNYQDFPIKTLAQVAALGREPNFFELLKAGILSGSLGLAGSSAAANVTISDPDTQAALDGNADLQILRIGANIIDEASPDNYPTTLTLPVSGLNVPVHGVKDLPYLYDVLIGAYRNVSVNAGYRASDNYSATGSAIAPATTVTTTQYQLQNLALVMIPQLFNPHVPSGATVGPSTIRIVLANAGLSKIQLSGSGYGSALYRSPVTPQPSLTTPITVSLSGSNNSNNFRGGVVAVTTATSATSFSTVLPWVTDVSSGFVMCNYTPLSSDTFTYPSTAQASAGNIGYSTANGNPAWTAEGVLRALINTDILIELQFMSPAGQWRTYDTLCGNEAFLTTGETGLGDVSSGNVNSSTGYLEFDPALPTFTTQTSTIGKCGIISKFDPRSSRLGAGSSSNYSPTIVAPVPGSWYGPQYHMPFGSGTLPTPGLSTGLWPQGAKAGWSDTSTVSNVADPDGTVRPADGWLGAVNGAAGSADLFQNVATATEAMGRPVILGRPFRSVAELGHVFRDSPWKSLSFFDNTSADGALLDLFSVCDEPPVVAGRIELASPQSSVPQALLSGVAQSSDGTTSILPSTLATSIATAYNACCYSSGIPNSTMPVNPAQLTTFMASSALTGAYPTASNPLKNYRESVVRALTAGTQARTWNLLIDVVAQVGRFPKAPAPTDLGADFTVEGEKRYWLSVALDRYTGKVIDEQWEPVNE